MRRKIQVTTRTSAEIDALCDAVFKDIKPIEAAKQPTIADQFEPYRKAVMKQRRRGLKWEQIAAGLGDPRVGEKISARVLRELFDKPEKAPKKAPIPPPPAPPPPSRRLVLDPATGKPIIGQLPPR